MTSSDVVAMTRGHSRHPIPAGCPKPLYAIMHNCWRPTPANRPTFASLRDRLAHPTKPGKKAANPKAAPLQKTQAAPAATAATAAAAAAAAGGSASDYDSDGYLKPLNAATTTKPPAAGGGAAAAAADSDSDDDYAPYAQNKWSQAPIVEGDDDGSDNDYEAPTASAPAGGLFGSAGVATAHAAPASAPAGGLFESAAAQAEPASAPAGGLFGSAAAPAPATDEYMEVAVVLQNASSSWDCKACGATNDAGGTSCIMGCTSIHHDPEEAEDDGDYGDVEGYIGSSDEDNDDEELNLDEMDYGSSSAPGGQAAAAVTNAEMGAFSANAGRMSKYVR